MLSPRRLGLPLSTLPHRPEDPAQSRAWGCLGGRLSAHWQGVARERTLGSVFGFGSEFGTFCNKKVFLFFSLPWLGLTALALFSSPFWGCSAGSGPISFCSLFCACARWAHYGACDYLKLQKFIHCGRAEECVAYVKLEDVCPLYR